MKNSIYFSSLVFSLLVPMTGQAFDQSSPADSLVVDAMGKVGIGTATPGNALEIVRAGTAAQIQFKDSTANHVWVAGQGASNGYVISDPSSAVQFRLLKSGNFILTASNGTNTFTVNAAGNLIIPGTLFQGSDINSKEDIHKVDTGSVLNRISKLNISSWKYKTDENIRHIGPMSQDFYKNFSLGKDDKHISTLDTSGVALAGIQELVKQSSEKDKAIHSLIQSLQDKITKLEVLVKQTRD